MVFNIWYLFGQNYLWQHWSGRGPAGGRRRRGAGGTRRRGAQGEIGAGERAPGAVSPRGGEITGANVSEATQADTASGPQHAEKRKQGNMSRRTAAGKLHH